MIGVLCSRCARLPIRITTVAAVAFALGFTVCAVIAVLRHGSGFSYSPLYAEGPSAFSQIVRIAAMSPWAFIGFENISHMSEEYSFPVRKVRGILLWSVAITTALYLLVSLLSVSAYPPEYESWMAYIRDMGNLSGLKAVPAFYAADYYLGQTGVGILMLALFAVILTSLIGNLLALSRLLYAAGRDGDAPAPLKKLNRHGIPENAILFIVAASLPIPFLGRTAIGWIVDVTTLGATLIYGMISHAVFLHAKAEKQRREQVTGILGLGLMASFLLLLLIPGLLPFHAMETESYVLFIIWAVLGLAYFRQLIRMDRSRDYRQRVVVWIILLVMMLFASMMWVSRSTENAAEEAVQRIYEYHQLHPEHDTDAPEAGERSVFLQQQADQITRTNTLYSVVSLGVFIISTMIMLNNYRDTRELGQRLTAAEARAASVKAREEHIAYARLNALYGDFLCAYIAIPETGRYREYSISAGFETFALPLEGKDFFGAARQQGQQLVYPDDRERFLSLFTRQSVLSEIERSGIFALTYRLVMNGKPTYVQLRAAMLDEKEGRRLIVGISDIDASVRQEEEFTRRLAQAQTKASVDALTGVKNKHAYLDAEEKLNRQIQGQGSARFAVTILDINDLKKVNDAEGHQAGDKYLRSACRIICDIFKHSPVFRVGGDEFAVISQGEDYERIEELCEIVGGHNREAQRTGGIVIACGMAKYENDGCVSPVFERADQRMYKNKKRLKASTPSMNG